MSGEKVFGTMLSNVHLGALMVPNMIPAGTKVEILKEIDDNCFYSGKGYVIYWEDFCFAYVTDRARVSII